MKASIRFACLVARAAAKVVTAHAVGTSLAVMLALGGCTQSHGTNGADLDQDGYDQLIDCNDRDDAVHPGAEDICGDGLDQDCDGGDTLCVVINPFPIGPDEDGDGYPSDVDCNDNDASINPGADEEGCCDTVDENCDGIVGPDPGTVACNCFYDVDGDGYGSGFGPGPDCNDNDPDIHPEAPEVCGNEVDENCDGTVEPCIVVNPLPDSDGDGYTIDVDCNDNDATVHPSAEDPPCADGVDQNCDGQDGDPLLVCNPFPAG